MWSTCSEGRVGLGFSKIIQVTTSAGTQWSISARLSRKQHLMGKQEPFCRAGTYLHKLLHLCHCELGEVLQKSLLHLDSCYFLLLLSGPLQRLEHGCTNQQVDEVADHQQTCLQLTTAHGIRWDAARDEEWKVAVGKSLVLLGSFPQARRVLPALVSSGILHWQGQWVVKYIHGEVGKKKAEQTQPLKNLFPLSGLHAV